ncbi:MAG: hypothetical protein NUV77_03995, partial [Thermoguttaceae bacterium]|nr:hypothetical protein [Thermoguttaceae bacterium]
MPAADTLQKPPRPRDPTKPDLHRGTRSSMLGAMVRRRIRPRPLVERRNDLGGVLMIRRCFVGLILVAGLGLLLPSAVLG